ncbi:MAG: ABC transporter substrate-binding protein [Syntrophorhabdales bacterium]|jgi:branched-chain amino acid transport system substrate-binding protein
MKRSAALLLALATFIVGALIMPQAGCAANTIKVGIVDTYSGPTAGFSQDVLDGFRMVVNEVNAEGGIRGRKIEFVTRDEKFRPDIGLSMAKELLLKEKVDILMGTINSATALAISDLAKKEKVPFLCTDSRSEKITSERGHRYVFGLAENTVMAGRAAAVALAKKPFVKYWIAGDDYEYGHAIADSVWNNLKTLRPDVQLMGKTWWKVGESDFTPYITAIMSAKPDFLIAATAASSMITFAKAAKATGLAEKIPFYQHTVLDLTVLAPLGMDAPEGIYGTNPYFYYYPDTPANKAFAAEFKKSYGRYPTMPALFGYAAGKLIEKGFEKAGSFDTETFVTALEGLVIDSPVGKLEMRACDHQLQLPMMFGVAKKNPKFPDYLIASDIVTIPYKDYMPSCAEVLKTRKK